MNWYNRPPEQVYAMSYVSEYTRAQPVECFADDPRRVAMPALEQRAPHGQYRTLHMWQDRTASHSRQSARANPGLKKTSRHQFAIVTRGADGFQVLQRFPSVRKSWTAAGSRFPPRSVD